MSEPKARELAAVSKIPLLSEQETATLHQILQVLGFDVETIALLWDKSEDVVKQLFRIDQSGVKIHRLTLTGQDLAWWCKHLWLRPGVIQKRLNFDESKLRLRKQGRSSTRVPAGWVGPPSFAIKGGCVEGRAFVELADMVKLSARLTLNKALLGQIAAGKYPLRLPWLRELMVVLAEAEISHPKVAIIEIALAQFPPGVRTPEEVFEAMTESEKKNEALVPASCQPQLTEEESMRVDLCDRFRSEFARRGLEQKLQQLCDACAPIQQLLHEWSIPIDQPYLHQGELEVLLSSSAFGIAQRDHPNLTRPFVELGEWLAGERKKVARNKPVASAVVKSPARPMSTDLSSTFVDSFGLRWEIGKQMTVGALTLPLEPLMDTRLEERRQTAQTRLYSTLVVLKGALCDGKWEKFYTTLSLERPWVLGLVDSTSCLTPQHVENIIKGLKTHFDLALTPQQLFGLQELPELGQEADQAVAKPEESEPLLFALGDTRTALAWSMMLRKYTAIRRWFERSYGLTAEHVAQLERGNIGVPVSVHLVLMSQVKQRIDGVEGILVPTVYKRLIALPLSAAVRDGLYVHDKISIPHSNWLKKPIRRVE